MSAERDDSYALSNSSCNWSRSSLDPIRLWLTSFVTGEVLIALKEELDISCFEVDAVCKFGEGVNVVISK